MKSISTIFLNDIISKFAEDNCVIHITDTASKILASTDKERIGGTRIPPHT